MAGELWWRLADRRDKRSFRAFSGTEPGVFDRRARRSIHPRPWEVETQAIVRERGLGRDDTTLLGLDASGRISAIAGWRSQAQPAEVWLQFAAVRLDVHGHGHGRELMRATVLRMVAAAKAVGSPDLIVEGKIHERNEASQLMCAAVGFEVVSHEPDAHGLRLWRLARLI